jgi:predicted porin
MPTLTIRSIKCSAPAIALAGAISVCDKAVAAEKISLSLGGYWVGVVVAGDQDDGTGEPAAGTRDHGIARESEVHFKGQTRLDNGVVAGVRIELEGETSGDQIDESWIYFKGAFGTLEIGAQDGAPERLWVGDEDPIIRNSLNSPSMFHVATGTNTIGVPNTQNTFSGDQDKLTYFTPAFFGLTTAVSYTPDTSSNAAGGDEKGAALQPNINPGHQSEVIEGAVRYKGKFGVTSIAAFVGYSKGDLEANAGGQEDRDRWALGGRIGFRGFSIGASYEADDLGTSGSNTDQREFVGSIGYRTDAWHLGAQYAHVEAEAGAAGGEDELDALVVGGSYELGPGIKLTGGLQYWNYQDNLNAPGAENEAIVLIFGTGISF